MEESKEIQYPLHVGDSTIEDRKGLEAFITFVECKGASIPKLEGSNFAALPSPFSAGLFDSQSKHEPTSL